jgi:hypothetical protein
LTPFTLILTDVVRNHLDCRVKPDNDKEDVGFQRKLESNTSRMSFPQSLSRTAIRERESRPEQLSVLTKAVFRQPVEKQMIFGVYVKKQAVQATNEKR